MDNTITESQILKRYSVENHCKMVTYKSRMFSNAKKPSSLYKIPGYIVYLVQRVDTRTITFRQQTASKSSAYNKHYLTEP